jgi:hypothetical protein
MSISNIMNVTTGKIDRRFISLPIPLPIPTPALYGTKNDIQLDTYPASDATKMYVHNNIVGELDLVGLKNNGYNYMKMNVTLSINANGTVFTTTDTDQNVGGLYINPVTYATSTPTDGVPYKIKGVPYTTANPTTDTNECMHASVFMPLVFKQNVGVSLTTSVCGTVTFTDFITMDDLIAAKPDGINFGLKIQTADDSTSFNSVVPLYFTVNYEPIAY